MYPLLKYNYLNLLQLSERGGDNMSYNDLDKWDVLAALSSGLLTAALDVLWVNDINLRNAHTWGKEQVDDIVLKAAKSKGYKGESLAGAVKKLEEFEMLGDRVTDEFGGGYQHHLRDFSHHISPMGLLFSILMQFTGTGFGTDVDGKIIRPDIPGWSKPDFFSGIYNGTVTWFLHILSDMAGSSSSVASGKEGTGLPGPLLSLIKELSSIIAIQKLSGNYKDKDGKATAHSNLSVLASQLFNGTILGDHDEKGKPVKGQQLRFDFRTELGIANEMIANKQYLPVLINEIIVSAFYSVRRLVDEIKEKSVDSFDKIKTIDIRKCLPFGNDTLTHMRMISSATFTSIDLIKAGITAKVKNNDDKAGFALDFMQSINYCGVIGVAVVANANVAVHIQSLHSKFTEIVQQQKSKLISMLPNGQADYDNGKFAAKMARAVMGMATPVGFVSAAISVYDEIRKAYSELDVAKENRANIEEECRVSIAILEENREEMEILISDYFYNKMTAFTNAFATMDKAVSESDIDAFIAGNNMIQTELGKSLLFSDQKEFDYLMRSDEEICF